MKWFLVGVGLFHAALTFAELFPWQLPFLLARLTAKLPDGQQEWMESQRRLVTAIVHNAGAYNAILAGGLLWAAFAGYPARDAAQVLLAGAVVAGVFGAVTLKSAVPAVQALLGGIGLAFV